MNCQRWRKIELYVPYYSTKLYYMKKAIIGSIVGALIIFIWQFLSFALINFHKPAQQYTEKQDAIMSFLESQQLKDGGYFMPNVPSTASYDEGEVVMKKYDGKPWARIEYHNVAENSMNAMIINMVRVLLVNIVIVLLFSCQKSVKPANHFSHYGPK